MLFKFKPLEIFLRKYRSKFFFKYVFIGYINILNPGTTENMNFKLRKSREISRYLFQMSQSSSSFQVGGINGYFHAFLNINGISLIQKFKSQLIKNHALIISFNCSACVNCFKFNIFNTDTNPFLEKLIILS